MFRLLQRLDDHEPRQSEAGGSPSSLSSSPPPPLHLLRPVTVLAEPDESAAEALEDWSRGLDWVHWLFSSVRHRVEHLHFRPAVPPARLSVLSKDAHRRLLLGWELFAETRLRQELAPLLTAAWQAAQSGSLDKLVELDKDLSALLPAVQVKSSLEAGSILLRSTRGARYQGLLGRYRTRQEEGGAPGHFLVVWAAVAHFFQLGLTNVVAEYLRLEWDMAARHALPEPPPISLDAISRLTSRLLQAKVEPEALRVVA